MSQLFPIRFLNPVVSRVDSTEQGTNTSKAQNIVFRPKNAIKGPPIIRKLWGYCTDKTPFETFSLLSKPGGGTLSADDRTVCVRIYHQGKNVAMFYNMWSGTVDGVVVTPGLRGLAYIGDDKSFTGEVDLGDEGPPLFEVLATGLDAKAMWSGKTVYGQWNGDNGVNDGVAIQLSRTVTPGKYRVRGTNTVPAKPTITLIEPENTINTQATRVITGRAGAVNLVFTANENNFAGEYGNNKIRVRIIYMGPYSGGSITSTMSGDGTTASPHLYTIYTTAAASSNTAIFDYVNSDSRARPILSVTEASKNATSDSFSDPSIGNPNGVMMTGGGGTGESIGLSNEPVTVFARYFGPGQDNLGLEGPSSLESNELIIDGVTFKDILVQVDINESADGGLFSYQGAGIRIYKLTSGLAEVQQWSLMNEVTPLTNTHRARSVIASSEASPLLTRASSPFATFNARTNVFRHVGTLADGDILMLTATEKNVPGSVRLFVKDAVLATGVTSFKLSLTPAGADLNVGEFFTATVTDHTTNELTVPTTLVNNQVLQIDTTALGIIGATDLYVINAATVLGVTTFKISYTPMGAAVDILANGTTTVHVNSSLTFQAMTPQKDRIWSVNAAMTGVTLTVNSGTGIITSSQQVTNGMVMVAPTSGHGIPEWVKLYVVQATGTGPTTFKLSLTSGGAAMAPTSTGTIMMHLLEAHEWTTRDVVEITSGVLPSGLTATPKRYNVLALESDGYGFTLSEARLGAAVPFVTNGGTMSMRAVAVSMVIGSTTLPGRAMSPDQFRPPPHRYTTMAGLYVWSGGVTGREAILFQSKDVQPDELFPEGADLEDTTSIKRNRSSGSFMLTGFYSDGQSLHIHFADGVVILSPETPDQQQEPLVNAGMVNDRCVTTGRGNRIIFLGGNREIIELNGARYGNRASSSVTEEANAYIAKYVSKDDLERQPELCSMMHETASGMIYFWMPTTTGLIGFGLDEREDGVVGPFTVPFRVGGVCKLEEGRSEFIIANPDGYLFYLDTSDQGDTGDKFNSEEIVLHDTSDPGYALPLDHGGYATETVMVRIDGEEVERTIHYAAKSILETGYMDMGNITSQKKFTSVQWRGVSGSRAYVKVTLINLGGAETSVWYGEMGIKERNRPHKVILNVVDTAAKLRMEIYSAQLLPWIIRDIGIEVQ